LTCALLIAILFFLSCSLINNINYPLIEVTIINAPKQVARQLLDHLLDKATRGDIIYELYVREKIEMGFPVLK